MADREVISCGEPLEFWKKDYPGGRTIEIAITPGRYKDYTPYKGLVVWRHEFVIVWGPGDSFVDYLVLDEGVNWHLDERDARNQFLGLKEKYSG